jgi:hypothetical protein
MTLAKIAEPTIKTNNKTFKVAPIHLNQVEGSFFMKLKTIIIIPVKQNICVATTIIIGGSGNPSLALIVFGILEKRYINNPRVINDVIKDSFENLF